ncbi:MAG: FG-GAP-like repeat-containing protein [Bacteroidota bacterium]
MKPFKLITLVLCFLSFSLNGQISFSNQTSLIPAISGNFAEPCAADMNGDYLDDIVRVNNGQLIISFQNTDGTYSTSYFDVPFQNSASWSISAADIDKNGYTDLVFGGGSRVSFVYADDDGNGYWEHFIDDYIFSQRSTFMDINNDGDLDAFVCHDVDLSHPYINDGTGMLNEDQSLISTVPVGGNYAAIWVDYDNDHDCDLYITKCRGGAPPGDLQRINGLYQNNGDGTFTEVGAFAGMNSDDQSWSTVFEDFDNDGDFDAFIVNHAWANLFMDNNGDGTFTDIIAGTGIDATDLGAWESMGGDFDNDGYMDIFSEVGQGIYRNNGDGTFTDIDIPTGQGAVADLNNDGFLDIFTGNSIYINNINANNWVKFGFEGIASNVNGIGSRVNLYGSWGVQTREVRSGQGFSPGHSLNVHFGIGQANTIDSVEVIWPSGTVVVIENPDINQLHIIPEADCLLGDNEIQVNGDLTICPGETVELIADAGYEYTWSNGEDSQSITVDSGGNYSVILTDGDGCISQSNSINVSLVEEEDLTISLDNEPILCEGTPLTLTASSGSNWIWSNNQPGQSISVTETGNYSVMADGICAQISSEPVSVEFIPIPENPVATDITIPSSGTVQLSATGNNLIWYDDASASNQIGEGNTLDVDVTGDATFYVQDYNIVGGELQDGGKADNAGGGGLPSSGAYSYFQVYEPFTLLSVRVYVPAGAGAGERTITLNDQNDIELASTAIYLEEGEHVIDLNFEVPEGTNLSLRCEENNLFRNSSGVNYPYPIGDVGELTDSFYGASYYYYFYDWKIEKEKIVCSSELVPVNVFVTGIENIKEQEITVLPNPVQDVLNIQFDTSINGNYWVNIYDQTGKKVKEKQIINTGNVTIGINCSDLAPGQYQLQLISEIGTTHTNFVKM